jgi:nucleoside-diphosphate-sugar epimerase
MTRVALLGARGQIARGLVEDLPGEWQLELFSRDPQPPHPEAAVRGVPLLPYGEFAAGSYDLVINAAGPGDPSVHRAKGAEILRIAETFDNLVLDYLRIHPATGYVNLSTGAVYGKEYRAASGKPVYELNVGDLGSTNAYALAKLVAETKHRQEPALHVADLRVFGYFSRRMDLASGFFMAQVMEHLRGGREFHTGPADFVRDFIAPEDLAAHIVSLYEAGVPNAYFDAVSARPVTKFEILEALGDRFGLRYSVDGGEPARLERPTATISAQDGINHPVLRSRITSREVVLREAGALCSGEIDGA